MKIGYCTIKQLTDYCNRHEITLNHEPKRLLGDGLILVDSHDFTGEPLMPNQINEWPRKNAMVDGKNICCVTVPQEVITAQLTAALLINADSDNYSAVEELIKPFVITQEEDSDVDCYS